jgi:hypothetical protein
LARGPSGSGEARRVGGRRSRVFVRILLRLGREVRSIRWLIARG